MSETQRLLKMRGITKHFGAIKALQEADFDLHAGEVMALLGENGAGKSTLVKILAGIHKPDAGSIEVNGQGAELYPASRSESAGVAVVQQELTLIPTLSVAENVFVGNHKVGGWKTPAGFRRAAHPFLEQVGMQGLSARTAGTLSVAEQQLVEVARLLARDARILIFDEPTAALADAEIERVHEVVRSLAREGAAVIYVTHRLNEVFELADRVTVFREGKSQPAVATVDLDMGSIVERMLGRKLEAMFPPGSTGYREPALEARDLRAEGLSRPVSLQVRSGEILGLVGQLGSGTTPLLEALGGARRTQGGSLHVDGEPVRFRRVGDAMDVGIGFCSGDRKGDGLFLIRPIYENFTAPALGRVTPGGWLSRRRERALSRELAGLFALDPKRIPYAADTLSGGNQQKVALGKWVGIQPKILLIDEPTRGVDVGARAEIYAHLRGLAEEGLAIIFASSDGHEVLGLADTVATFYRGRHINTTSSSELDEKDVLRDVAYAFDEAQEGVS
jgi:ribose transport system ATP-binding protein